MKKIIPISMLVSISTCLADIELPRIFSNHMILQQQTSNAIWGWADAGESVSIMASWGADAKTKADANGKWKVFLKTPGHGTGHSLTITAANTIQIKNVAIGEVWLCTGQSNMGWALGQSFGGEDEAATANMPNFRIFKSAREHWHEPLDKPRDRLSAWKPCNPESAAATSAVSYYFGKTLHEALGIPFGIIVQAYAGTPIEGWMPKDIQKDDMRLAESVAQATKASRRFDKDEYLESYKKELAEYNAKIDAGETMKNAVRPLSPPIITRPSTLGHQMPGHIFNAMIYPIRPYGIRGAIWYQGERNAKNVPQALNYRKQLAQLIGYYRSSWHQESGGHVADDFSFQFTQLPSYNPVQTVPVEGPEASWAVSREMMRLVAVEVPNTGMAVSVDTGDPIMLHPKNKKPIGIRHAKLALQQDYAKKIVASGPELHWMTIKNSTAILSFNSVGGGLKAARPGMLNAFAIAGADRVWHWADAEIRGPRVIVSSAAVVKPVAVRYAWAMNPSQRNLLYNAEGLPASPFRTDDWPLYDKDADIIEVFKPKKPDGYVDQDWARPAMQP